VTAHCRYCHRPLTDPESVARGVGPVCAESAAAHTLSLFQRSVREVLAEDYGTTLEGLTEIIPTDEAPAIVALLARELLRLSA
jgi:hypothetical protein